MPLPSMKSPSAASDTSSINYSVQDSDNWNANQLDQDDDSLSISPQGKHKLEHRLDEDLDIEKRLHINEKSLLDDKPQRLVIAIDYGTTFTGVAYATPKAGKADLEKIVVVRNWGPKMSNSAKIPSVFSYSPMGVNGEQQWGSSISPDAVTMVNTKLELDVSENKIDELELILQVLDGTKSLGFEHVRKSLGYPEYTWKTPEGIVTDYLTKIFEYLIKAFDFLGEHLRSQVAVDIVLTVPVRWSYRAKNATLRAVQRAGFNGQTFPNLDDIIMVTEPEAAAIYTARHLKETQTLRSEILKKREHFILCDAGGGTVDVVAYQVVELNPTLVLRRVTVPTSNKCGSAYIDLNFKHWLRWIIGDKNYQMLEPRTASQQIGAHTTEGGQMRDLVARFIDHKKTFSNRSSAMKLDLPLKSLNIPGKISEGELTITRDEMAQLFDPCVDKVVELIQGQIQQIESQDRRTKNVLLVGGFGGSPYLQEELQKSLNMRNIMMHRPSKDNSWTAVVQGAVMYGVEKSHHQHDLNRITICAKSYGIVLNERFSRHKFDTRDMQTDSVTNHSVAKMQLTWLVRKGDMISTDTDDKVVNEKEFAFAFQTNKGRRFTMPLYMYPDEDDDVPDRFQTGQHEIQKVGEIQCDLSQYSLELFDQHQNPQTRTPYYVANLVCKASLYDAKLWIDVYWEDRVIGNVSVLVVADASTESSPPKWYDAQPGRPRHSY